MSIKQNYTLPIMRAARKYGISENLALAVAKAESGMDPNALSKAGAIGLFQLMPGTAKGLGVDPKVPLENIDGGVKYLSQLLTRYHGNTGLALAAYNAGPAHVDKSGGIPNFPETKAYVTKILGWVAAATALDKKKEEENA